MNYIKGRNPVGKPSAKASAKKRSRSRSKGKKAKKQDDRVRVVDDTAQAQPQGGGQGGGGGGTPRAAPKRTLPRAQAADKCHCISDHETLRQVVENEPAELNFESRTFKELCDFGKAETRTEKVRSLGE